jgi:hypothetical protein
MRAHHGATNGVQVVFASARAMVTAPFQRRFHAARAILLVALLAGAATVPASAAKAPKRDSLRDSPLLWATVNVCDTPDHPDTVGIRGSMPGSGDPRERMTMRFQLQYFKAADKRWHNIGPTGDSGRIAVGSGRYKARQTGRNFTVRPPGIGGFQLRGAVTFEWRRGGKLVHRARERTRSGHPGTAGADPADFSAATCTVRK